MRAFFDRELTPWRREQPFFLIIFMDKSPQENVACLQGKFVNVARWTKFVLFDQASQELKNSVLCIEISFNERSVVIGKYGSEKKDFSDVSV